MMSYLSLIDESLQKMSALKSLILSAVISSALWKVKRMKRTQHMYSTKSTIYVITSNSFI